MDSISYKFALLTNSDAVPPLNDEILESFEHFFAFSLDSEYNSKLNIIFNFLETNLDRFQETDINSLTPTDEDFLFRLITLLSKLRPKFIPPNILPKIENYGFFYLKNTDGRLREISFALLCNHFIYQRKIPVDGLYQLLNWVYEYMENCAVSFDDINIRLFSNVTSAMRSLFLRIDLKNNDKIPDFFTPLINLLKIGLSKPSENFCYHHDVVISKSLRFIMRLFDFGLKRNSSNLEALKSLRSLIPDDARYFHIYENYILTGCHIYSFEPESEFAQYIREQLFYLIPFACNMPFAQNRRFQHFIRLLMNHYGKIQTKTIDTLRKITDIAWPLCGCLKLLSSIHVCVFELIYKQISLELIKTNQNIITIFIRELTFCFSVLRNEYELSPKTIDHKNWMEFHIHLLKLINTVLAPESKSPDENFQNRLIHPSNRLPLYRRITKHFSFVLDVIGIPKEDTVFTQKLISSPEFKEKTYELLNSFAIVILTLTANSGIYFSENMIDLLPKHNRHTLHQVLHQCLIKAKPKPIFYHLNFFQTIVMHFDELFLPTPPTNLLEIINMVFHDAFLTEQPSQPVANNQQTTNNNQQQIYAQMCFELYRFFIKGAMSRQALVIKLLLYIIRLAYQRAPPKLQQFTQRFTKSPFSIPNMIRYICEDTRVEAQASSLALYLFPFCEKQASLADWFTLFIPALESDQQLAHSIMPFYTFFSSKFADQMPTFPPALQYRLTTALALSLTKVKNTDANPILTLLSRIPAIASEMSRTSSFVKPPHSFVKVDGVDIDINIVSDTLKKIPQSHIAHNIDAFCPIFGCAIDQIDFPESASLTSLDTIAETICRDKSSFIDSLSPSTEKGLKTLLFYRIKYLENKSCHPMPDNEEEYSLSNKIFDEIDDSEKIQFFESFFILVYNKSTSAFALQAIDIMSRKIDISPSLVKLSGILLYGAQYNFKTAKRILTEKVFKAIPNKEENIIFDLARQYLHFCSNQSHNIAKLALTGLRYLEQLNCLPPTIANNRKQILSQFSQIIQTQRNIANFIFYKPFDDIGDVPNQITELLDLLLAMSPPSLIPEVVKLVNSTSTGDHSLNSYFNAKFAVKTLAYYFSSISSNSANQELWNRLVNVLRSDKIKQFYGYFLKQLTKRKISNLPSDCLSLFPSNSGNFTSATNSAQVVNQGMLSANDLEFIKIILINGGQRISQNVVFSWINITLRQLAQLVSSQNPNYQSIQNLGIFTTTHQNILSIGTKVFEIIKVVNSMDFSQFVHLAFEATIVLHQKSYLIHLPIDLVAERYPNQIINAFIQIVTKTSYQGLNNDAYTIFLSLLQKKHLVEFKKIVIEKLFNNADLIIEYISKMINQPQFDADFIFSNALNTAQIMIQHHQDSDEFFIRIFNLVKRFSVILPRDSNGFIKYRPSTFIPLAQLCLSTNSFAIFSKQLIPFFFSEPKLFAHPLFVKMFMNKIHANNFSQEQRNEIFTQINGYISNPDENNKFDPSNNSSFEYIISKIDTKNNPLSMSIPTRFQFVSHVHLLKWLLIYERSEYFPEDFYNEDNNYHIGFDTFHLNSMPISYLIHYYASMIQCHKFRKDDNEGQHIKISDINSNMISYIDSSISAIAIINNCMKIDSVSMTLTRFFHIFQFLQNNFSDFFTEEKREMFNSHLYSLLSVTPSSSRLAAFCFHRGLLSFESIDDSQLSSFALTYATFILNSVGILPEKNTLYFLPVILRKIKNPPYARYRVFEELSLCTLLLLTNYTDNFHQYGVNLPGAFEEISLNINLDRIEFETIEKIRSKITEISSQESTITPTSLTKIRAIIKLFASIAGVLLHKNPLFCPQTMLPSILFHHVTSKDFQISYQHAMINCIKASGRKFADFLIKELYQNLQAEKKDYFSYPLKTPFATVCQWIYECTTLPDQKLLSSISLFLDVFKPETEFHIVNELLCLKQPLHYSIEEYVQKIIHNSDSKLVLNFSQSPRCTTSSYILFAKHVNLGDLATQCWRINWAEINPEAQILLFAKILFPNCLTNFVKFLSQKQLKELINAALVSIDYEMTLIPNNTFGFDSNDIMFGDESKEDNFVYKEMLKFGEYFCSKYINSHLSECFATSFNIMGSKTPLPMQTPFAAMNYLENRNFYDESLGILKTTFKELNTAATYHQLSNYSYAKAHYIQAMQNSIESKRYDIYFHAISFLRSCEVNLSLPGSKIPFETIAGGDSKSIVLPFLQNYTPSNSFTTFFSTVYLPYLFRFALIDGLHLSKNPLQQRQTPLNPQDVFKLWTNVMLKTLDKQTANASNFTWRLALLQSSQLFSDQTVQTMMQESIKQNRINYSSLLMKSGYSKGAIKQYELALFGKDNLINPANSSSSILGMKSFKINRENFPRIAYFISKHQNSTLPQLLQFRFYMAIRDKAVLNILNSSPPSHLQPTHSPAIGSSLNSTPSSLPSSVSVVGNIPISGNLALNLNLNSGNSVQQAQQLQQQNSNKQWLNLLITVLSNYKTTIDPIQVFKRIQKELIHANKERASFLIALSLGLVRLEPSYQNAFSSILLVRDFPEDLKSEWIKWLHILIQYIKHPSKDFFVDLFRSHPVWFMLIFRYRNNNNDTYYHEVSKELRNLKERRQLAEFENGFRWIHQCENDFRNYSRTIQAHQYLYQALASSHDVTLPKELNEICNGSLQELAKFCDENPCVFKTSNQIPDIHSFLGFKFPTIRSIVSSISVKADGKSEALLKLTTVTGETRKFSLISHIVYKFNFRESLFMFGISKIFDHHPSSRTRSSFAFYPQAIPIHSHFVCVPSPLISMHILASKEHIALRLLKNKEKYRDHDESPFSHRERKVSDVPVDAFARFYASITARGSLIDFLFAKQSFASHLAVNCVLRILFSSPTLAYIPNIAISGDGQRLVIPDFLSPKKAAISQIPITRSIRAMIPDYIMHGSFATTWVTVIESLHQNTETLRIYLRVLHPDEEKADSKIEQSIRRLEIFSTHSQEKTDTFYDPFPICLVNHLIERAVNIFESQPSGFGWL